jgi:hypothetical protein
MLSELGQVNAGTALLAQQAQKRFTEAVEKDSKAEFPWAAVGIFAGGFILYSLFSGKKPAPVAGLAGGGSRASKKLRQYAHAERRGKGEQALRIEHREYEHKRAAKRRKSR